MISLYYYVDNESEIQNKLLNYYKEGLEFKNNFKNVLSKFQPE